MKTVMSRVKVNLVFLFIGALCFASVYGQATPQSQPSIPQSSNSPSSPTTSQSPSPQIVGISAKDSVDIVLNFQRSLNEQAKAHQELLEKLEEEHQLFLEKWYDRTFAAIGGGGAVFAIVLGFFNFQSSRNIRKHVQSQVGDRIESEVTTRLKKIDDLENSLRESKARIEKQFSSLRDDTNKEVKWLAEFVGAIGHAAVVLSFKPSPDADKSLLEQRDAERREVAARLIRLREKAPTNRAAGIFIGRLFRQLGDLPKAIDTLDKVIKAREEVGMDKDDDCIDHADLLFNKACYLNLLARKLSGDGSAANTYRTQALDCLEKSVKMCPTNGEDAKRDDDLKDLGHK